MESIDSVGPGFTSTQVREMLGAPGAVGRGDWAGFEYEYGVTSTSSSPAEIAITFAEDFGDRVIWIIVNSPYPGLTREGIGIGTDKRILRAFYGKPSNQTLSVSGISFPGDFAGDVYLGDSVAMILNYDLQSRISRISLARTYVRSLNADAN